MMMIISAKSSIFKRILHSLNQAKWYSLLFSSLFGNPARRNAPEIPIAPSAPRWVAEQCQTRSVAAHPEACFQLIFPLKKWKKFHKEGRQSCTLKSSVHWQSSHSVSETIKVNDLVLTGSARLGPLWRTHFTNYCCSAHSVACVRLWTHERLVIFLNCSVRLFFIMRKRRDVVRLWWSGYCDILKLWFVTIDVWTLCKAWPRNVALEGSAWGRQAGGVQAWWTKLEESVQLARFAACTSRPLSSDAACVGSRALHVHTSCEIAKCRRHMPSFERIWCGNGGVNYMDQSMNENEFTLWHSCYSMMMGWWKRRGWGRHAHKIAYNGGQLHSLASSLCNIWSHKIKADYNIVEAGLAW